MTGGARRVTVVGGGYVGLVTGVCLADVGHSVTCVDVREDLVARLNRDDVPFHEPGLADVLRRARMARRFEASLDLAQAVRHSDVTFVAVNTPSDDDGIDLSAVRSAAEAIGRARRDVDAYHVVVVKSTVVPGTTDTVVREALERTSGRRAGEFGLAMNPEFLREGSAVDDFRHPDRIVIGEWDERSGAAVAGLYALFDAPILRTSLRNAELIKYASNALLAVMISFSNEIAALCEATEGTDVDLVLDGLHLDRRLQPLVDGRRLAPGLLSYLRAGIGFGGSCLPKDVAALRSFARARAVAVPLLDGAWETNRRRPAQIIRLLSAKLGSLAGKLVGVIGMAFKAGTDDLRQSPALAVVDELIRAGARVRVYDPLVPASTLARLEWPVTACSSPEAVVSGVDAIVLTTADPLLREWDWRRLASLTAQAVLLDGRNVLRGVPLPPSIQYLPTGRPRMNSEVERPDFA